MNRSKALSFLPVLFFAAFSLTACSGPKTGCTVNCGSGGTATVNLTLVSDAPPASPSLLSYKVTISQVTLTPATGTAFTFTPNPAPVLELMRLQSDSVLVGTLLNVPAGNYSSMSLSLGSPQITFLNNTSAYQLRDGGLENIPSVSDVLNPTVQTSGTFDTLINQTNSQISDLTDQIANWDTRLSDMQDRLKQQFNAMELALSQNQTQGQWLAGQIASLNR